MGGKSEEKSVRFGCMSESVSAPATATATASAQEHRGSAADVPLPRVQPPSSLKEKNRRKRWLEMHPEYFGSDLENADPLLYDRMIRRFQSAEEREKEGRKKGFTGIFHADLMRGEARLEALNRPHAGDAFSCTWGPNGEILVEDRDDVPVTKEEGFSRWRWEMEMRFVKGADYDFDYMTVDQDEALDEYNWNDREERYYDEEEPGWVTDTDEHGNKMERVLKGETGIQDY
ncbi:hypothetical protein KEM54_006242 [Ascosphaera aggregata]|nr:hypothetical protein KEM54_006242 [Ascosphaera aggregata]